MTRARSRADADPWGALAFPLHLDSPVSEVAWRDNAFLAFWDTAHAVFGVVHFSTSPNVGGRRARCSIAADGTSAEVIEPLDPGSFRSASMAFDLEHGLISVEAEPLTARLAMTPRFTAADYSQTGLIPDLVDGHPLRHYQQGADVTGQVRIGRHAPRAIDGQGLRDRTWGPRDESAAWSEYAGVIGCLPGYDLTAMKFRDTRGRTRTHGFVLGPDEVRDVHRMDISRDAAGLIDGAQLLVGSGTELSVRMRRSGLGFWVPMGAGGSPPVMSAYDDAAEIAADDGQTGGGFSEQGVLRHL